MSIVRDAQIMRAAKSAARNVADAASPVSPADRARVFAIARGEAAEAVEIAVLAGDASRLSQNLLTETGCCVECASCLGG